MGGGVDVARAWKEGAQESLGVGIDAGAVHHGIGDLASGALGHSEPGGGIWGGRNPIDARIVIVGELIRIKESEVAVKHIGGGDERARGAAIKTLPIVCA